MVHMMDVMVGWSQLKHSKKIRCSMLYKRSVHRCQIWSQLFTYSHWIKEKLIILYVCTSNRINLMDDNQMVMSMDVRKSYKCPLFYMLNWSTICICINYRLKNTLSHVLQKIAQSWLLSSLSWNGKCSRLYPVAFQKFNKRKITCLACISLWNWNTRLHSVLVLINIVEWYGSHADLTDVVYFHGTSSPFFTPGKMIKSQQTCRQFSTTAAITAFQWQQLIWTRSHSTRCHFTWNKIERLSNITRKLLKRKVANLENVQRL